MSHTPGPWKFLEGQTYENETELKVIGPLGSTMFVTVGGDPENRVANSRLIAAAPTLLEDAKQALSLLEKWRVENKLPKTQIAYNLRHTIAKIESSTLSA